MRFSNRLPVPLLAALLATSPLSQAGDADAGDYESLPPGSDIGVLYYQHDASDTYRDQHGRSADGSSRLRSDIGILRFAHYTEIFGFTANPQILVPFGKVHDAKVGGAELDGNSGLGDIQLAATVWLLNEPQNGRWFGISPFLIVPTGQYDKHDPLNIGENRWKGMLQAGYVQRLGDKFSLDLLGDVTWYGDNDRANGQNQELSQDTSYHAFAWLRYHLDDSSHLAFGLSKGWGGKQELDGVDTGSRTDWERIRLSYAKMLTPSLQGLFTVSHDLEAKGGFERDYILNFRLLKLF
ncbi:transporter [Pseudomonas sp. LRF_L74]|uniref:transporter n=1 Tax=Pseudomonas sp. LRF_L74 TaxID=3369422 RepID=UPI003F642659